MSWGKNRQNKTICSTKGLPVLETRERRSTKECNAFKITFVCYDLKNVTL